MTGLLNASGTLNLAQSYATERVDTRDRFLCHHKHELQGFKMVFFLLDHPAVIVTENFSLTGVSVFVFITKKHIVRYAT